MGPIFKSCGMWGHSADINTGVKCQVDWSKGLGLWVPKIGCFPLTSIVALTTVLGTAVLHCDRSAHRLPCVIYLLLNDNNVTH